MVATGSEGVPSPTPRPGIIPPVVVQPGVEKLDSPVTIPHDTEFPRSSFTMAKTDRRKGKIPQCIAHRGFKAKYPENTLLAFRKAVAAGVDALETDLHITKDEVVVLSHDGTLKRCFGRKERLLDRDWDDIKDLRTIAAPHEPMPRLTDLLEYLRQPGLEDIWVLLDIKLDNEADTIMRLIASTVAETKPSPSKPWKDRIVLGIWAAKYLPLAANYLPAFPIVHIGFKVSYARHFFTIPNVGFNMLLPMLIAPGGRKFIRDCQERYHRQLFAWTVNDVDKMEWCIQRGLDGVITDDPTLFLDVCERQDESGRAPAAELSLRTLLEVVRVYMTISSLFWLFRRKRLNAHASPALIQKVPSHRE